MNPVFVSTTNLWRSKSLLDTLSAYHDAGFQAVELGSGHTADPNLFDYLKKFSFEYAIHNYFPLEDPNHLLDIASQDSYLLSRTIQIARNAISICQQLGGKFYGIHAGYRSNLTASTLGTKLVHQRIVPLENAFYTMVETIQKLCDFALEKKIDIVVENHVLAPFNLKDGKNELLLMCTAEEIVEFSESINRENFGILLDVGHLNVTATTLGLNKFQFIEKISHWIKLFHLSDNDGSHDSARTFDQNVWFAPIIKSFPKVRCVVETKAEDIGTLVDQVNLINQWQS